ncbi:glycosyltransferase family protein [Sphingobacterium faecium]|uniref:glycosyltransferase family 4 protein n=1 Tax=Sphingobacterium faecium TaxID=34087 RepID=UPI000D366A4B|nr:glycosyltransferase family 4 protein [Sphingobacterium faecium]
MKVLFLIFHGFSEHNGISKKIWGQINGLKQNGAQVTLCHYTVEASGHRVWKVNEDVLVDLGKGTSAKIRKRIDYRAIQEYVVKNNFSLVYIRSDHNANPFTIRLVKSIRQSGATVMMEVPTYPYDQEYNTAKMKLELCVDRLFRRQLAKQLDAVVTFSNFDQIFGQKTLQISNGIDFGAIPIRHPITKGGEEIHLLAVAEIHYWHGFDRLIQGLALYQQQQSARQVIFHLVGELTGERERQDILVPIQKHGLQQQVILHGALWGTALDTLFDQADFAIGSLGRHRTGIDVIRTLKNREYAARGIPFIYSESDPDFDQCDYIIKATADESPIDIQQILDFINQLKTSPDTIRASIQELSWQGQMNRLLQSDLLQ